MFQRSIAATVAPALGAAAALVAGSARVAQAAASPRIMVVGDSISQGLEATTPGGTGSDSTSPPTA